MRRHTVSLTVDLGAKAVGVRASWPTPTRWSPPQSEARARRDAAIMSPFSSRCGARLNVTILLRSLLRPKFNSCCSAVNCPAARQAAMVPGSARSALSPCVAAAATSSSTSAGIMRRTQSATRRTTSVGMWTPRTIWRRGSPFAKWRSTSRKGIPSSVTSRSGTSSATWAGSSSRRSSWQCSDGSRRPSRICTSTSCISSRRRTLRRAGQRRSRSFSTRGSTSSTDSKPRTP